MKQADFAVKVREEKGKGAARRLRRQGIVPAVFYGHKTKPVPLAVPAKELQNILHSTSGASTFLNLKFEGGSGNTERMAIIKEIDMDPVTDEFIHVDFYELLMDEKITADVPVRFVGKAKGVEMGGTLQPIRRELEVKCLPKDLPEVIEVDVTDLGVGESIHIDDIKLPAGVEVPHDVNFTVAVVLGKKGEKAAAAEEGEEETTEA